MTQASAQALSAGSASVQFTCPADQQVVVDRGNAATAVNLVLPTSISPDITIVGVRSDGQSLGDPYPVGVTTITWVASGNNGGQAHCTQTITVEPRSVIPSPSASLTVSSTSTDPHIDGITPDRGPLNQRAIIHGTGFGDVQGTSYVLLGGRQMPVMSWSADAIVIVINPLAYRQNALALNAAYPVQVITPGSGKRSNTTNFFITNGPPAVYTTPALPGASDQPAFVQVQRQLFCSGDQVTFYGSGFGNTQGTGFVSLVVPLLDASGNLVTQEFAVPVLAWSENAITFLLALPAAASPGTYTAIVHRGNGKDATGSFFVGTRNASGTCISHAPVLQTLPGSVSFPAQLAGVTSPAQGVVVTNKGTAPLTINSIGTTPNTGEFSADMSCLNTPLQPGDSCTIMVTFTPGNSDTGTVNGALTVTSNGGLATIQLAGQITPVPVGQLLATPNPLIFSTPQPAGMTSAPQNVTVQNTGTAALTITDVQVTSGPFASGPDCTGTTLNPGDTCMIPVTFTPTPGSSGSVSGTLMVTTSVGVTPVTLSGTVQSSSGMGGGSGGIAFDPDNPLICGTTSRSSTPITLNGSGFGSAQGTVTVVGRLVLDAAGNTVSPTESIPVHVISWSDTAITVQLPPEWESYGTQGPGPWIDPDNPYTISVTNSHGQTAVVPADFTPALYCQNPP